MATNNIIKGAIHIHSTHSDGTGNLKTIVKAAKEAGLDFIAITDHNYLDSEEGIYDGVYVIKGEEISPAGCNHYLAFGINSVIEPNDNPQIYVDKVREQGGFGFAAHPDEGEIEIESEEWKVENPPSLIREGRDGCYPAREIIEKFVPRKNSYNCIPWTDKNIIPDGVEIWNWFSKWADALDDTNICTLAYSFIFKHRIVTSPSKRTLEWWDNLNNQTKNVVPAIGGVDAHALKIKKYIVPVTVYPYITCFKTVTNVLYMKEKLSKNFAEAKKQILNALKNGNNIILNRHIYKEIPNIYIKDSNGLYYSGETIKLSKDLYIYFESDKLMEIRLFYNGEETEKLKTNNIKIPVTKSGKYRIEVLYKSKGFLYTNPFCIED